MCFSWTPGKDVLLFSTESSECRAFFQAPSPLTHLHPSLSQPPCDLVSAGQSAESHHTCFCWGECERAQRKT